MSNHLSEFNSVFDQVSGQGIELNDSLKALFLLITLPDNWDTFHTTVSTNAIADGLSSVTVEASLLIKEVNWKNNETSKNGSALVVRGKFVDKNKGKDRNQSRNKSKACNNVECYHCHKKGHHKIDCHQLKHEKGKGKKQDKNQKEEKTTTNVKIEEVIAISEAKEGDILFTSSMESVHLMATNKVMSNDWIIDSGASFHVSPNCEWFSTYNAGRTGRVMLGNGLACDIVGVGDVQVRFNNGSTFTLHDVRHVPLLTKNLVSAGQLDDAGYTCMFGDSSWKISKGAL